jgi:L-aminopeptidase/D-esterase-like protein
MVSALVALNALGDIRDLANGKLIAGARKSADSRELIDSEAEMKRGTGVRGGRGNTTLGVVATNAKLNKVQANKLAEFGSLGVARTIYPVNTMSDGDTTFALACGELEADVNVLGVAAAEAMAQSVLRAARMARTMGGIPGLAQ